jgi:hypothetical protein
MPESANDLDKDNCHSACEEAMVTTLDHMLTHAREQCAAAVDQPAECKIQLPPTAKVKPEGLVEILKNCTNDCARLRAEAAKDAKERDRAAAMGGQLVTAYRRCMLAEDSKREAVLERLHDPNGLYADRMRATNDRCRRQNQCDWLEAHSDVFECVYGE